MGGGSLAMKRAALPPPPPPVLAVQTAEVRDCQVFISIPISLSYILRIWLSNS